MSPFEHLATFLCDRRELGRTIAELRDEVCAANLQVNKVRIALATERALVDMIVRERDDLARENERLRAQLCKVSAQGEQS